MKNRLGSERGTAAVIFKKTAHFNTNFSVRIASCWPSVRLIPSAISSNRSLFQRKGLSIIVPGSFRFKKFQTFQHDSLLLGLAERFAQRMTIGISQMIGSRRFDRSADFPTDAKTDGGNPGFRFHAGPDRPSGCRGLRKERGGQYPPASAEFFLRR